MGSPLVISLAGPPASGKTTLCQLLGKSGEQFEQFVAPPIPEVKLDTDSFEEFMDHQSDVASNFIRALRRAKIRSQSKFLICDRGLEDIICYSEYVAERNFCRVRPESFPAEVSLRSNYCLFLDVDQETLGRRHQARGKPTLGRGLKDPSDYWEFYRDWFLRRDGVIRMSIGEEGLAETEARIREWAGSILDC